MKLIEIYVILITISICIVILCIAFKDIGESRIRRDTIKQNCLIKCNNDYVCAEKCVNFHYR